MAESSPVTIITDGISEKQKKTEKFQSAYLDMLAQLTVPGFIPVLCAHEAAHVVYFTLAGMKQYEAMPARIIYDPAIGDYAGHLAAIQITDMPQWEEGKFQDWFSKVACGHAAGGVVARKLMPSSDGGDPEDKENFKAICAAINQDPNMSIDFESVWKQAQDLVAEQLKNPEIMDIIHQEAAKLRPLFGL